MVKMYNELFTMYAHNPIIKKIGVEVKESLNQGRTNKNITLAQ